MQQRGRILLVDDNPMDIELALDAFKEVGIQHLVCAAAGGHAALAYLASCLEPGSSDDERGLPDVILIDLKMPRLDGHELLRRLKSDSVLRFLPVIILTSSLEEKDRARCYDSGANGYLVKPVSFDGLVQMVRAIQSFWLELNIPPPSL